RLRRVSYPDGPPREFEYGGPGDAGDAGGNRSGRLAVERSEAGVRSFRYDRHGNITEREVTFNRLSQPDQNPHNVPYRYRISYEFGQPVRLIAGNFIETHHAFKPRSRRLAGVSADEHDSVLRQHGQPARAFQRLDYTYDVTGNLTELRNDAPFDPGMHPSVFV